MQFESRKKRRMWADALLGMIPDSLISLVVAYYMEAGVIGFFSLLIGLQLLYFLIWLKNTIFAWAYFQYIGRKHAAKLLLDHLQSNGFPEPGMYEKSGRDYFDAVMSNERLQIGLRLKAAAELGAMGAMVTVGLIQHGVRSDMACEDALEAYKGRFQLKADVLPA
jgi:hypothetical protein